MGGEGFGGVTPGPFLWGVCRQPNYRAQVGDLGLHTLGTWLGASRPHSGVRSWAGRQSHLLAPDMVEVFCLGSAGSAGREGQHIRSQGLHGRWSWDPAGQCCWRGVLAGLSAQAVLTDTLFLPGSNRAPP